MREKNQDVWAVYWEVEHVTQGIYDAQFSEDVQLYPFDTKQEWKAKKSFCSVLVLGFQH